ncbi:MAG: hypothetical protein ABIO55_11610 [Ginsengibacter sp.]
MKTLITILLLPLQIFAQNITGLWIGFIHTTDKDIPYELAISENNGKLTGYTHTTFTVNGVSEIGVKAVTVKNENGSVLVEDENLVYNDFSEAPAKGVRQSDFLTLIIEDTAVMLNGTFKTTKTKIYRSITGSIQLRKTDVGKPTKIIPKLNELNLSGSLSFLQPKAKDKQEIVTVSNTEEKLSPVAAIKKDDSTSITKAPVSVPVVQPPLATQSKPEITASQKSNDTVITQMPVAIKKVQQLPSTPKEQVAIQSLPVTQSKPRIIVAEKLKDTVISQVPVAIKKPQQLPSTPTQQVAIQSSPVTQSKPKIITVVKPKENATDSFLVTKTKSQPIAVKEQEKPVAAILNPPVIKKEEPAEKQTAKIPAIIITPPQVKSLPVATPIVSAAEVSKRKTENIQSVFFKSDSLVLTLYDNGEVDGDIVSVLLNGKVILANQALSTNAITKTIYITPDLGDSLQLVMYAENLGSIPPNTGLLILQDGKDRYEIRFAGDFQKNSAVLLRRKKINQASDILTK